MSVLMAFIVAMAEVMVFIVVMQLLLWVVGQQ
jgi:hypothetical protein